MNREQWLERLAKQPLLKHSDPLFKFGRGYTGVCVDPKEVWSSRHKPRDDHDAPHWLTASEFNDDRTILIRKVKQLANLLGVSKKTVIYTGAGISAAVIGQAARSGSNKVGWKCNTRAALPTYTHHALYVLHKHGYISSWEQQNHDGLPQKAGYPQHAINEIHGSWFNPSNPVVKYSGSLHDEAFPRMTKDADTADLTLVLGTSLGGLTADMVAIDPAIRSTIGKSLGAVCINLQQTDQDGKMTLRLFEKSDVVMKLLLDELGLAEEIPRSLLTARRQFAPSSRVLVPYDKHGKRLPEDAAEWMVLDLSKGAKVRISPGHNIHGARQPAYMHIGRKRPYKRKNGSSYPPNIGQGTVLARDDETTSFRLSIESASMSLGQWWVDSAIAGAVETLPIVNVDPRFLPRNAKIEPVSDRKPSKTPKKPHLLDRKKLELKSAPAKTRSANVARMQLTSKRKATSSTASTLALSRKLLQGLVDEYSSPSNPDKPRSGARSERDTEIDSKRHHLSSSTNRGGSQPKAAVRTRQQIALSTATKRPMTLRKLSFP